MELAWNFTYGTPKCVKKNAETSFNASTQEFELSQLDTTETTIKKEKIVEVATTPMEKSRVMFIVGITSGIVLLTALVIFCVVYFAVVGTKTPTYKDTCSVTYTCNSNLGLICDSSTSSCRCNSSMYWNGFKCTPLLTFGSSCYGGTFQCHYTLTCINQLCQCSNVTYYQNGVCLSKLGFNSICSTCSYSSICPNCTTCSQCQDYSNFYCDAFALTCLCPVTTQYYDSFSGQCQLKKSYNVLCTSISACNSASQGLYCQTTQSGSSCPLMPSAGYCNCPVGTYWSGSTCKSPETYYAICFGNCSCDSTKFLWCDMLPSDPRCICLTNYYWDTTISICLPQLTYYSACSLAYQCIQTKGLSCTNSLCQCTAYSGNWFWSKLTLMCIECPESWTFVSTSQRCVKGFNDLQTWSYAQQICQQNLGDLVILNDTNLMNAVRTLNLRSDYNCWIDAGDSKTEGTYAWAYDGTLVSSSLAAIGIGFCLGYPTINYNTNCLSLRTLYSPWCLIENYCSYISCYICEKLN